MEIGPSTAAIVTGGASGLGGATARALSAAGAPVAILDMDRDRGEALASEIDGRFIAVDVTDEASIARGLEQARDVHGNERICVTCAGIVTGQKTVAHKRDAGVATPHKLDIFQSVISVNLVGTFAVASQSAAGMAVNAPDPETGERGVVVMTSSIAATDGQLGQAAYAASKGGVASLALPMARDLARDAVRVMAIMPGLFHTPMFDSLTDELQAALASNVPFPSRLGDPEEFAELVKHIVANPMLNGSAIRLDGALRLPPR
ncbi:MAG: SDR family NAD(P)-dependent oxidoreductase [Pseudomonadota bacterium]